jgi:predicted RND superfamily exporter protein
MADFSTGVQVRPAGYLPLYVQMMRHIVETQLYSFALAFGLIMAVLSILFRSLQQLLLIAISNLLPIVVLLGTMGWLGMRLDAATVTIAAIVFGLIVDDTVQFLYRYREERKHYDVPGALSKTADTAGHAMTITTLVMITGFSVLGFAAIKSIVFFGLLVSLTMVAALFTDLLVVPAVLALRGRPRNA